MTRRTVARGSLTMEQDITKNPTYLWTAIGSTAVDGSDGIYYVKAHANDAWEYGLRGDTPVLRLSFSSADSSEIRAALLTGLPSIDFGRDHRVSGLYWFDDSWYTIASINWSRFDPDMAIAMTATLENEPGFRDMRLGGQTPDLVTQIPVFDNAGSPQQAWSSNAWVQWVLEWDATRRTWDGRAWSPPNQADPGVPIISHTPVNLPACFPPSILYIGLVTYGVANAEIAWLKYEVL